MAYRHRKIRPYYFINLGLSLLVLASFTVAGAKIAGISRAATTNPYGFADYCLLENNTTVIYGWGADPNATSLSDPQVTLNAGGHSVTVFTNQAGYHDTDINTWIDKNRPGDPKPGTYGFRAPMPGLYKGNSYTLTGVVLNVGPGSSTILTINSTGYNKGDTTHPYFANNLIPDACLATAPTPPPPPPPPTPNPAPQPGPSPAPNPSPGPRPTPSPVVPTKTPDTAPKSAPSNAVDTTVTVGTLAVSIAVPADNATAVHLVYGTSPVELNQSTPDQTVSGDPTTIPITGLAAATDYYYQIVRSNTGQTSTSPTTGFTTLGYSVALHFVDNHDRGIQDIPASLDSQKSTQKSDNDGTVLFNDITTGDHTFWYTYNSRKYRKDVTATADTVNPDDAAAAKVITLNYTVNLETLAGGTPAAKANKKSISLVAAIVPASVAVLAIILGIIGYTRRRRKNRYQDYYEDFPSMGLPEYQKAAPPPEPILRGPEFQPLPPAAIDTVPKPEDAAHLGESLKEMVLRSMAEEARKREAGQKDKPG